MPLDVDIVHHWVQAGVDVIRFVLWEDDVSSVATLVEGIEDCRNVVGGVFPASEDGAGGATVVFR